MNKKMSASSIPDYNTDKHKAEKSAGGSISDRRFRMLDAKRRRR